MWVRRIWTALGSLACWCSLSRATKGMQDVVRSLGARGTAFAGKRSPGHIGEPRECRRRSPSAPDPLVSAANGLASRAPRREHSGDAGKANSRVDAKAAIRARAAGTTAPRQESLQPLGERRHALRSFVEPLLGEPLPEAALAVNAADLLLENGGVPFRVKLNDDATGLVPPAGLPPRPCMHRRVLSAATLAEVIAA